MIASPNSSTSYTVTGTDANGCTSTSSILVNVTLVPDPIVTNSSYQVCQNAASPIFNVNATDGYELVWYNSASGGIGTTTNPVVNTALTGSSTYFVAQRPIISNSIRIAITGRINNTSPDVFSFLALSSIPSGTEIYFTDNGWTGSGFRGASATDGDGNENLTKFIVTQSIPAGTQLISYASSSFGNWVTSGSIPGTTSGSFAALSLGSSGEQIYAFTTSATTNPLFATSAMTHLFLFDDTGGFEQATSSTTGSIPPGLTNGIDALSFNYSIIPASLIVSNNGARLTITGWYSYISQQNNWISGTLAILPVSTFEISTCESLRQPINVIVSSCTNGVSLNLTAFLEGYYSGSSTMVSALANSGVNGATGLDADSITLELRDSLDPTIIVDAATSVIKTDGTISVTFNQASSGSSYWIVFKHRSSIQTWSSAPVIATASTSYDFSTSSSQAYGDNMTEVEPGIWAIFTGDMNQDGFVDNFDYDLFNYDNLNFAIGYYNTDLNGDGFVDNFDFDLFNSNNLNFVMTIQP